jgi:hypothetical protein
MAALMDRVGNPFLHAEARNLRETGSIAEDTAEDPSEEAKQQLRDAAQTIRDRLEAAGIDPSRARIAVSGTGGTGKSTLAKEVARTIGLKYKGLDWAVSPITRLFGLAKAHREMQFEPGSVVEQTHLTNNVDPDRFDAIIRVHRPYEEIQQQVLKRGRGAAQMTVLDYPRLGNAIETGFKLTEGPVESINQNIELKVKPPEGFKADKHLDEALTRLGIDPKGLTRNQKILSVVTKERNEGVGGGVLPYLKLAQRYEKVSQEFAPGIPKNKPTSRLPHITPATENRWVMAVQDHETTRSGGRKHFDLRLVDPDAHKAHSWAIPKARLPEPGESLLAVQTFTHTPEYALHFGEKKPQTIGPGYGAGRVRMVVKAPTEIIESDNSKVRFNVYEGRDNQEYLLRRTHDDKWLLMNTTVTKDTANVPQSKPKYREVAPDAIDVTDADQLMMAKIDGAHNTFRLDAGKPLRIFSHRPTERDTGIIEHTHRFLPGLQLRVPDHLDGLVLRGELFAADPHTGRAREAVETGAILNSGVWKSRETQQHSPLRAVIFDVARQDGKNVEALPYQEKLKILRRVNEALPILELPPMAETAKEKVTLLNRIRTGQESTTREGVVLWPLKGGAPIRSKFVPDHDIFVREIFPESGGRKDLAGGFAYSWTPRGKIVGRVGTGLNHDLKRDMLENPEKYIGRVARVQAQDVYRDKTNPRKPGALRAPSFKDWHLDRGLQPFEEKIAKFYHGSPRLLDELSPSDEHGDPDLSARVFATPSRTFATAYAGKKWGDRDLEQSTRGGGKTPLRMLLREMRPGALKDVYDTPGYLYTVPDEGFAQDSRRTQMEVTSPTAVTPLKTQQIANVLRTLKRRKDVELLPYDPTHPTTETAVRRAIKRMREMTPEKQREYRTWRMETAPPEMKRLWETLEKTSADDSAINPYVAGGLGALGLLGGGLLGRKLLRRGLHIGPRIERSAYAQALDNAGPDFMHGNFIDQIRRIGPIPPGGLPFYKRGRGRYFKVPIVERDVVGRQAVLGVTGDKTDDLVTYAREMARKAGRTIDEKALAQLGVPPIKR